MTCYARTPLDSELDKLNQKHRKQSTYRNYFLGSGSNNIYNNTYPKPHNNNNGSLPSSVLSEINCSDYHNFYDTVTRK